jgi:hypothetical protein
MRQKKEKVAGVAVCVCIILMYLLLEETGVRVLKFKKGGKNLIW